MLLLTPAPHTFDENIICFLVHAEPFPRPLLGSALLYFSHTLGSTYLSAGRSAVHDSDNFPGPRAHAESIDSQALSVRRALRFGGADAALLFTPRHSSKDD